MPGPVEDRGVDPTVCGFQIPDILLCALAAPRQAAVPECPSLGGGSTMKRTMEAFFYSETLALEKLLRPRRHRRRVG